MIVDEQIFRDEHLPRQLPHRNQEVSQLSRALEPALDNERPEDVLITGPSGVGKTALARYAVRRLHDRAAIGTAHVRCLGERTGAILRSTLQQLPIRENIHRGLPIPELGRLLDRAPEPPCVVILDEADDLPEKDALRRLLDAPRVSVIVVVHDRQEWLARVDSDLVSYLEHEQLRLTRYGSAELADILEDRADVGLRGDVWERPQLERIADEVAGVARDGIQSLRAAAELAAERGHEQIEREDVADSFARARERIRRSNLQSLPIHHHVLYEIVRQEGPIDGETLHERYEAVADAVYRGRELQPVGRRQRRRTLSKLADYDLIDRDGQYTPINSAIISEVIDLPEPSAVG